MSKIHTLPESVCDWRLCRVFFYGEFFFVCVFHLNSEFFGEPLNCSYTHTYPFYMPRREKEREKPNLSDLHFADRHVFDAMSSNTMKSVIDELLINYFYKFQKKNVY